MVVETNKGYLMTMTWILSICCAIAVIMFLCVGSLLCSIVMLCLSVPLLLCNYIVLGRTITFDEAGCTVYFRGDVSFVKWEDLPVKRIEPPHIGGNRGYTKGCVFFSTIPSKKSPTTDPATYALFHPMTCFWVYFKSDKFGTIQGTPGIYEVDKESFLNQLSEWRVNVEITF